MDWKLEVIIVPVSDVDRAKAFYSEQVGFVLDVDHQAGDFRVVQLTPPGSGCSITFGVGLGDSVPGSLKGMTLVVSDVDAAREQLASRGVDVTPRTQLDRRGVARRARRSLELLLLLRRPRWQQLDRPGEARQLVRATPAIVDHGVDAVLDLVNPASTP